MPPKSAASQRPSLEDMSQEVEQPGYELPATIIAYGPPSCGKTTFAATVAAPLEKLIGAGSPEPTILKGVIWIMADDRGLVTLAARNVRPEFTVDIGQLHAAATGNMDLVIQWVGEYCAQAAEQGAKIAVTDTATSLGDYLEAYYVYGAGCPIASRSGVPNTEKGWGLLAEAYRRCYRNIRVNGFRQIILVQPKVNSDIRDAEEHDASTADRAQAQISRTDGNSTIVPGLSGRKFLEFLRAQSSITFWLDVRKKQGKKTYVASLDSFGLGEQKSRYHGILDAEEEPDLGKIFDKISANRHQQTT